MIASTPLSNGVHPHLPILNRINGTSTPRVRPIHVLKFGGMRIPFNGHPESDSFPKGTSVGKFPQDIVNVVKSKALENNVAIVCSAVSGLPQRLSAHYTDESAQRSSSTKTAGTTNRLLRAATEAENHRDFKQLIEAIQRDHLEAADSYVQSEN